MKSLTLNFGKNQLYTSKRMQQYPMLGQLTSKILGYTNLGNYARAIVFKKIVRKLPTNTFTNILDLGCGYGEYSFMMADAIQNSTVIALDIDKQRANTVNKTIGDSQINNVQTFVGKIEELPACKFDFIFSVDVFEHILEPEMPFKEAYNRLHDGGFLLVKMPNINQRTIFPSKWFSEHQSWLEEEHIGQVLDLKGLENKFKEQGFEIYHSAYSDGYCSRLGWELAYLGKKKGLITQILSLPIAKLLVQLDSIFHGNSWGNAIQVVGRKVKK